MAKKKLTFEQVLREIEKYNTDPKIRPPDGSSARGNGESGMLWPRFERAMMNHVEDGEATISRYAIWAKTASDVLSEAVAAMEDGDIVQAKAQVTAIGNNLAAFSKVLWMMDEFFDTE